MKKKYKFLVFDRDGTLIKHIPYLHKENEVELLPFVKECLKTLKESGFKFFLHTNQSGVARGYFELKDAIKCNNKMLELIGLGDNIFEKICIASDFPPSINSYRKPSPKFGKEIIDKFSIEKNALCYIGDSISDLETALNLDCTPLGLNTGEFDLKVKIKNTKLSDSKVFRNFKELTKYLISK